MADENRLWGAPRIHGELLKLGIVVSERTVSRYLPGRLRAPSQTWRTFLANHLGQFTFISPETSLYAPGGDDVVDGSGRTSRQTPLLRDGAVRLSPMRDRRLACFASTEVTWEASSFTITLTTASVIRNCSGRGPPTPGRLRTTPCVPGESIGPHALDLCDDSVGSAGRARTVALLVNVIEDARLVRTWCARPRG